MSDLDILHRRDTNQVEMDISRNYAKITIFFDQKNFRSALIKTTYLSVSATIVRGIGDVEMTHELTDISQWSLNQECQ
jgi:hypothetical protein